MLVVVKSFVGLGYNMPAPGTWIDPAEPVRSQLLGMGVAQEYGMKVDPVPPETKKKRLSGLSHLARPLRLKMFKN